MRAHGLHVKYSVQEHLEHGLYRCDSSLYLPVCRWDGSQELSCGTVVTDQENAVSLQYYPMKTSGILSSAHLGTILQSMYLSSYQHGMGFRQRKKKIQKIQYSG